MTINKMLSGKLLLLVTLVGVVVILVVQKYQDRKNANGNQKNCNAELNREISGVVAKAFYDENINIKAFVIHFTNGEKYVNPIFERSLNGYVDEGDSVYKKPGTFKFIIFKKGYEKPVVLEDTVNCSELK